MRKDKSNKPFPLLVLNALFLSDKIQLRPDYQRESVWKGYQQGLLIDSILRGLDVPKLYFRRIEIDKYEYEVVDGQQRLRTIMGFFADDVPIHKDADPIDNYPIAKKKYSELPTELQMVFQTATFDVVVLSDYTQDDVEEMFLRLQMGTPLNAAEKRRVTPGTFRTVVIELAEHKVFEHAGFSAKRFAFEDVIAKLLHLYFVGEITDIRPDSINNTYERHQDLTARDRTVQRLVKALNFLDTAFRDREVGLKKYAYLSLGYLVDELLSEYTLNNFRAEFGDWYVKFEQSRIENNEKNPDDRTRDQELTIYQDTTRNDSPESMTYRHDVLKRRVLMELPLEPLDGTRQFSEEQRRYIFRRDGEKCTECGELVTLADAHIDHVKPHSKGGMTTIENGRLTCASCNLKLGSK